MSQELATRCATHVVYGKFGFFLQPTSSGSTHPYKANENRPKTFNNKDPNPGEELKLRFHRNPQKLEYSYDGGPWHSVAIARGFGIEESTACCPVILSYDSDPITVTSVKSLSMMPVIPPVPLKSNATYLVTNELKVEEVSSQLDLLRLQGVTDVSSLQMSMATVGHRELWRLIRALVNGKKRVLENVFVGTP